ncbi:uncharacterized protein BX663DRAFT_517711 [Cokeromyces recurvatus]|uniref:uncharacterized protein n=1 Tax=Cokeromyces recurvatus TaxID=90255 RepID=UPI00221EC986|nr:uncharacterized protein BX663DRAFT_517711 [Cokeromyces recurvatus]KAI7900461.1 hypothetical protein BX663DRAFT_517711 [Cokeromyces recurvatus]
MSIRKQSPYGPFVERVFLPAFRISVLFLALLAIIISSWLETNDSIESCAFRNTMSFHQVHLYRNISSNLTIPDSVSFGLWKSCYFYALNCTCSSTNLKYQPDIPTILQIASSQHNAVQPVMTKSSFVKIIPLLLATTLLGIAFLIGILKANHHQQGKYVFRKLIVGLLFVALVLIVTSFGWTYDQYAKAIHQACTDSSNSINCAKYSIGIEVIIFGITIGLTFISLIFWFIASHIFNDNPTEEEEEKDSTQFFNQKRQTLSSPSFSNHDDRRLSPPTTEDQNELAVWNDIAMFDSRGHDHDTYYDGYYSSIKPYDRHLGLKEKISLSPPPPPPPPLATTNFQNNMPYNRLSKSNKKPFTDHRHFPPPPPSSSSAATTNQHRRSKPVSTRKESHDSTFTFGENNRRKSSVTPMSGLIELVPCNNNNNSQKYDSNGNRTPTDISSPHPFQSSINASNEMIARNSFCMTPYYDDNLNRSNSSASGDSTHYFQAHNNNTAMISRGTFNQPSYEAPVAFNMSPQGIEHPLNKKIITDKRIQNYFQKR